jgi:peroxiredoxin
MSVGVGDPFPEFELPDLDGRLWTRSDLHGRPTVLLCFASW